MTSDIFYPEQHPRTMPREKFLALLDDLRATVEADDSMEGSVTYAWSSERGQYDVHAVLRVGNAGGGQGGMILVEDRPYA